MKESVVLVADLNPVCTELARHLTLAGINLCILQSPESEALITEANTQADFLFTPADIGQKVTTLSFS
jgi:molybdopterin/thiamine biosynthesis adenylyltransferase